MSLGITPPASFEGMQATAEHFQRGLGSPMMHSNSAGTSNVAVPTTSASSSSSASISSSNSNNSNSDGNTRSVKRFTDPVVTVDVSKSPPRANKALGVIFKSSNSDGRMLPPLQVDCCVDSMRESSISREADAVSYNTGQQTAKKFTDEVITLVSTLEKVLNIQKARGGWQLQQREEDGGESPGRGVAPKSVKSNASEPPRPASRLSLSSIDSDRLENTQQRHQQDDVTQHKDIESSSQSRPQQEDFDAPSDHSHFYDEPELCEFRPLGHDVDSIFGKKHPQRPPPAGNDAERIALSPPWPDRIFDNSPPQGRGGVDDSLNATGKGVAESMSIDDCLAALEGIRRAAVKAHRCVQDEIYEARQKVDTLEQRMNTLSRTHDQTVQRLLAANTKVSTTMTLLQQEREALQSVILKFAQASSPTASANDASAERHQDDEGDPNRQEGMFQSITAEHVFEDEIDDNELFGSPPKRGNTNNGNHQRGGSPASSSSPLKGRNGAVPSPLSTVDDIPNNPRLLAAVMLPHELANDVLQSRRQLQQYIRLIACLPSALSEHHDRLQRAFDGTWLPSTEEAAQALTLEKERCYDQTRLHLEGEL